MSRMSELSGCIADLKAAAAALISAAETLTELYSGEEPAQDRPESRPITKEEVRAELAAKATAGYGAQVRALLKRYGAAQLSAVKAEDYASLLLAARAIGNEVGADGESRDPLRFLQPSLDELPAVGQTHRTHVRQRQRIRRRGQ